MINRISIVSYLNSIPFIYGIKNHPVYSILDLSLNIPSVSANKFLNNEIDIGLVPVAIINKLQNFNIFSNYCIGSYGKVDTVCVFSDTPIYDIEEILIDYHSITSVNLLKLLLKNLYNISPNLKNTSHGFEKKISKSQAALVIGDKAFDLHKKHKYVYDLSEAWFKLTGLPFVFACWVAKKEISQNILNEINSAFSHGLNNINTVLKNTRIKNIDYETVKFYLKNRISYDFDRQKKKSMDIFLEQINDL
tara:strand:+ start:9316 stop:10062 length:747 start_codon:yes stop_codon:yes gene_type:complete